MINEVIFYFFILFQFKHFFCDYILQNEYMLQKNRESPYYLFPLCLHSLVHAVFTFFISIVITKDIFISSHVFLLDFASHFIIDRFKASPKFLGRFKQNSKYFWWALGFDQMCHHLISCLIIYALVCIAC